MNQIGMFEKRSVRPPNQHLLNLGISQSWYLPSRSMAAALWTVASSRSFTFEHQSSGGSYSLFSGHFFKPNSINVSNNLLSCVKSVRDQKVTRVSLSSDPPNLKKIQKHKQGIHPTPPNANGYILFRWKQRYQPALCSTAGQIFTHALSLIFIIRSRQTNWPSWCITWRLDESSMKNVNPPVHKYHFLAHV